MNGVLHVEWDNNAQPPRPRYYGYGEIDGQPVQLSGELRDDDGHRSVRLVIRPRRPKAGESAK